MSNWNDDFRKLQKGELPQDDEARQHDRRTQKLQYSPKPSPGAYKSGAMLLAEKREQERAEAAAFHARDEADANDPAQIAWEREQMQSQRRVKSRFPFEFVLLLVVVISAAKYLDNDLLYFVIGFPLVFGGVGWLLNKWSGE